MKTNINNAEKIETALEKVNGNATAFTVTSAQTLHDVCADVENMLGKYDLPKKLWAGAQVVYTPSGPSAKNYRYDAVSTTVRVRLGHNGNWFLTDVTRTTVSPRQARRLEVTVSQASLDTIIKGVAQKFRVQS